MNQPIKPGDLFRAHQAGKSTSGMAKRMKAAGPIKHSGTFHGKSNALGHGGRAAQLKARGVPGGVIGNLARAAQAAPGQKNYHGSKKKKVATPSKEEMGMVFKKKHKGAKNDHDADDKKKQKGATCMKCKGGHPTSEHGKHLKKKQ